MRSSSFVSLATLAVMATLSPHALACWGEAGQRYGVSADLLYAIARVESNLNPKAVNSSHFQRTKSYDIGLMQINNRHLSVLSRHGISESDLFDPCTNIQVGAWLLSDLFSRHGTTWDAVGAYNAANPALRRAYVDKVRRHLRSADDGAHRANHGATRTAFTRGDHRAPVVATLP